MIDLDFLDHLKRSNYGIDDDDRENVEDGHFGIFHAPFAVQEDLDADDDHVGHVDEVAQSGLSNLDFEWVTLTSVAL